jgi:hypothetical protein
VSATADGTGVIFLADADTDGSGTTDYYLATKVAGSEDLTMVKDVPGHVAIHEGARYEVVEGYAAILTCNWDDLQELIDRRGVGEARED